MIKIGLTGNIGSGKTLVASIFENLQIPVFQADVSGRELINSPAILQELINKFGPKILDTTGNIDRKNLADIVFSDTEALGFVNALLHPLVRQAFEKWCETIINEPLVICEAAILFETGYYKQFEKIILVTAPVEIRIARVIARDNVSRESVLMRMKNQWLEEAKIPLADFIINNDGNDPLIPQCLQILRVLTDY